MILQDILNMLQNDPELEKLAEGQEDPTASATSQVAMASQSASEPAGTAGNIPAATPTTGAGVPGSQAGQAVSSEVAGALSGDSASKQELLKDQLMAQAAQEQKQQALVSDADELPGVATAPTALDGSMISLQGGVTEKMAQARFDNLIELGLQKEAELADIQVSEDNYVLGQIFARGMQDHFDGKAPAFQKEASVFDTMSEYTEAEIDEALAGMSEDEMDKLAAALEEKNAWEKIANKFEEMGHRFASAFSKTLPSK